MCCDDVNYCRAFAKSPNERPHVERNMYGSREVCKGLTIVVITLLLDEYQRPIGQRADFRVIGGGGKVIARVSVI